MLSRFYAICFFTTTVNQNKVGNASKKNRIAHTHTIQTIVTVKNKQRRFKLFVTINFLSQEDDKWELKHWKVKNNNNNNKHFQSIS